MLFYPLVFGWWEVLIIAFVILLIFGGKKIPELMKGLGKGVKSFKEGINEIDEQVQSTPSANKETTDGAKPIDKQ